MTSNELSQGATKMTTSNSNMTHACRTFFVYGTLKTGEANHHVWPAAAQSVEAGYCTGRLHDLGAFPAMREAAEGIVCGELVTVGIQDLNATLDRLDRLEGNGRFYQRKLIDARNQAGQTVAAWAYFLMQPTAGPLCATGIRKDGEMVYGWSGKVHAPDVTTDEWWDGVEEMA